MVLIAGNVYSQATGAYDPSGPALNKYNLDILEEIIPENQRDSYQFSYCRWGNFQSKEVDLLSLPPGGKLYYSSITESPLEDNLFLGLSLDIFSGIPLSTLGDYRVFHENADGLDPQPHLKYPAIHGEDWHLFRKYRFNESNLHAFGNDINKTAKKIFLLIHGWNGSDSYNVSPGINDDLGYWYALPSKLRLLESDWEILGYDWKMDADTGGKLFGRGGKLFSEAGYTNASEAAEAAFLHGWYLGDQIESRFGDSLERIHIIAHSAGTWCARSLVNCLTRKSRFKDTNLQLTLLDPFVPGNPTAISNDLTDSVLTTSAIEDIALWSEMHSGADVYQLENYYQLDSTDVFGGSGPLNDIPTNCTSQVFSRWRAQDVKGLRIPIDDGIVNAVINTAFLGHFQPIYWYRDQIPNGPAWTNSMHAREPIITSQPVARNTTDGRIAISVSASTRSHMNNATTPNLSFHWKRSDNLPLNAINGSEFTNELLLDNINPLNEGFYYCEVTNGMLGSKLVSSSSKVHITVSGASSNKRFVWPVRSPNEMVNKYATYNLIGNDKYHAGFDLTSSTGSLDILAVESGRVRALPINSFHNENHRMGNVVIIDHGNGPYSLYAHLAAIHVADGAYVAQGEKIGTMGETGFSLGVHLHFELKMRGVLGTDSDDSAHWGYTPDLPNHHGFLNPWPYFDQEVVALDPTIVTSPANQRVRTGPGSEYQFEVAHASQGQRFEAFARVGNWFQVRVGSSGSGWIEVTDSGSADPLQAPSGVRANAVSENRINLTWQDNSTNEDGFRVRRKLAGSSNWEFEASRGENVTSFSDVGLAPDSTYVYSVGSYRGGQVAWSGEREATTSPRPSQQQALVVAASTTTGDELSVNVYSWEDSSGSVANSSLDRTRFTRHANTGTTVSLYAPAEANGLIFQFWLVDQGTRHDTPILKVPMDRGHAVVAVYANESGSSATLTGLVIEGPSRLDENSSASYRAKATFSDGESQYVDADWDEDSSDANIKSNGVLDTDSVSRDRNIEIEASYTHRGVTKTDTKSVRIEDTSVSETYSLTLNVVGQGEIGYSPKASRYESGTLVSLHANREGSHVFSHWSGDASGTEDDIDIRMTRNKSITAHFVSDPDMGYIRVNILPPEAAAAGAQWRYDNFSEWRDSGNTQGPIDARTGERVKFNDIPGWVRPRSIEADIVGGQTTVVNATYEEILGALQVAITPSEAVAAGAAWRFDGGPWQDSGTVLTDLSAGNGQLEFKPVDGWSTPPAQNVLIQAGLPSSANGAYSPPAGVPIISQVSPTTGPLEGNIEVTIIGANFSENSTVRFGSTGATSVHVISADKLVATLPPSASYGSVDVVVESAGQTALKPNSFAYDVPLGFNMTQLGQLGGICEAVAATHTRLVLFGEGNGLVAADYSNPDSPVILGRIHLPGLVRDIEISGDHAFVANRWFGLQIIDISNPAAMARVGFYDTPFSAARLKLDGNLAFVADSRSLQVIDCTNRSAPTLAGEFSPPSNTVTDVALILSGNRRLAALSNQDDGVYVVDATDLSQISTLHHLEPGTSNRRIASDGRRIVVNRTTISGSKAGVIYDFTDPLQMVETQMNTPWRTSIAHFPYIAAGVIFNGRHDIDLHIGVHDSNPPVVETGFNPIYDMSASRGLLLVAGGEDGLACIDIENPYEPFLRNVTDGAFQPEDIVAKGSHVYLATDDPLFAVDVSNPAMPLRKGSANSDATFHEIHLANNAVYGVTQNDGMYTFSLNNPQQPSLVSHRFEDLRVYGAGILGQHVVLGGRIDDLYLRVSVADGQAPNQPDLLSDFIGPQIVGLPWHGLASNDELAYMFSRDGLRVIDFSSLTSPQIAGTLLFETNPNGTAIDETGDYLYSANYKEGLTIVDCTNPNSPRILTHYARNGLKEGHSVEVLGNLVFYGDGDGLNVLDCTNPAQPTLVAAYDTPGQPDGLAVSDNFVYVADRQAGLQILRLDDFEQPRIEITLPSSQAVHETTQTVIDLSGEAHDNNSIHSITWSSSRGGGGLGVGSSSWSIDDIPLLEGQNIITVTVLDSNGNASSDIITITSIRPDTIPPVVLITEPSPSGPELVETSTTLVSGSATDNVGIVSLSWSNDRGDSGQVPRNAGTWTIPDFPLELGVNLLTLRATDAAGNEGTATATFIRQTPDVEAPDIAITFPTINQTTFTTSNIVNLSGEASDNRSLESIYWSNNRGPSGSASGKAVWSANAIPLYPGINVITVTAIDDANLETSDTITVHYFDDPIRIGSNPVSSEVDENVIVTFSVSAEGPSTGFQWLRNGEVLVDSDRVTGANSPQLSIAGALAEDEGTYSARVYALDYPDYSVLSRSAVLLVDTTDRTPPTIEIVSPAAPSKLVAKSIRVAGTAADNKGIIAVKWKNSSLPSGIDSGSAVGTSNWSIEAVPLRLGANSITVTALDAEGNESTASIIVRIDLPDVEDKRFRIGKVSSIDFGLDVRPGAQIKWLRDGEVLSEGVTWSRGAISLADAGRYQVEIQDDFGGVIRRDFVVSVTGLTYEKWLRAHLGASVSADDPGYGRLEDPMNDGCSNLMKYALGRLPGHNVEALLPEGDLIESGDQTFFEVAFERLIAPDDIRYVVEASFDLNGWKALGSEIASTPMASGITEKSRYRVPIQNDGEELRFAQLRVVPVPALAEAGKIIFSSVREGSNSHDLYVMNPDGSDSRRITSNLGSELEPSVTKDGSKLVFVAHEEDAAGDIYQSNIDGTEPENLTERLGWDRFPSISPDGRHVVYSSWRGSSFELYSLDTPSRLEQPLTQNSFAFTPAHSRDGERIVYSRNTGSIDLFTMSRAGADTARLTDDEGQTFDPVFNHDDSLIAFVSEIDGNLDIYVMEPDGSGRRRLTTHEANDSAPEFSPDGYWLAFESLRSGNADIFVIGVDGEGLIQLTSNPGEDLHPAWYQERISP